MKALFLVTLSARIDREQVVNYLAPLKGFGMWFYSMPSSFFIYSSLAATNIGSMIQNRFGSQERVFVAKVTGTDYYGWMPKEHWTIVNNQGAEQRFDLVFKGFFSNVSSLPSSSGVYCVYRGKYDGSSDSVKLYELLYIGKAIDIRQRHTNHENFGEWKRNLKIGEQLWYSYADEAQSNLVRCEAALIYLNQPRCNHAGKDSFRYYDTFISATGATVLLKTGIAEESK